MVLKELLSDPMFYFGVSVFVLMIAYFWYSGNKEKEKKRIEREEAMEKRIKMLEENASDLHKVND